MSLTDSSSWAPHESDAVLWLQKSWIIGDLIGAVAYGVHATLYFTTIALLRERRRTTPRFNIWIVFSTTLFVLSSIGNACQFKILQLGFVDFRDYPGPPAGWESGNVFSIVAISVYVVSLWPQDALLMYRFRVIVAGSWVWTVIPAILFLANVGVGCTIIAMVTLPQLVLWATTSANLLTAYFSISVAFNVLLTVSIVTKLVRTRRSLVKVTSTLAPYLSVSAMLIESAVIYSVFGLMLVVAAGIKSAALQNFVLPTLSQVQLKEDP
ncbi:hypothetical protein EXIGLDRAFT_833740 [Exidia glandulosa HHB12029]|uniref:Uncharacterized protein n=1 Tax=Exidia glandulosa HHB12029 TaxID=1314781 RepID=A0A165KF90_EXIGL|nr:hypothetical protein EXIGLDRAFT_833740 [Exidia glandulosa HHB12029]